MDVNGILMGWLGFCTTKWGIPKSIKSLGCKYINYNNHDLSKKKTAFSPFHKQLLHGDWSRAACEWFPKKLKVVMWWRWRCWWCWCCWWWWCQWMSMNVNECQWMSMNVNECQGGIWSSLFSERAKPSRISPNRFLDISTDVMKMLLASVI